MEMTINGAKLTFKPVSPRSGYSIADEYPEVFEAKKKQVYYWTCEDGGSGKPDPRPARFVCDVDFLYPRRDYGFGMLPDLTFGSKAKRKSVETLLQVKLKTFEASIRKLYPTRRPGIPYATLLDPWSATHDVVIHAQETYLRWYVEITRDNPYFREDLYIQFPVSVVFTSDVVSACNPRGDLAIGDGAQQRVRWKLGRWGTEMVREWQIGIREAHKKIKEHEDWLKKLTEEYEKKAAGEKKKD